MNITILGSGTSTGVPMIGCDCPVCTSTNPKNKRLRSSVWVEKNGRSLLIDTSTDLRQQALTFRIHRIDAVLYTHDHADHAHGIDDLRCFNVAQGSAIPCYGPQDTMDSIRLRFGYIFEGAANQFIPQLSLNAVEEPFQIYDFWITPILVEHGDNIIFGYRIGDFAYLTDCSGVPEKSAHQLQNLQVLVIDGLRQKPHKKHFSVYQALDTIKRLTPQKAFITHLSHSIDHEEFSKDLPQNVELAYDGLKIFVTT